VLGQRLRSRVCVRESAEELVGAWPETAVACVREGECRWVSGCLARDCGRVCACGRVPRS
jgi:hypothetical protein